MNELKWIGHLFHSCKSKWQRVASVYCTYTVPILYIHSTQTHSSYDLIHPSTHSKVLVLLRHTSLSFGSRKHTILHQTAIECPVHSLQTVSIPQTFEVLLGFEHESAGIVYSNPIGVTPWCNRLFVPVFGLCWVHDSCVGDNFCVFFNGDEVGMGPELWKLKCNEVKTTM